MTFTKTQTKAKDKGTGKSQKRKKTKKGSRKRRKERWKKGDVDREKEKEREMEKEEQEENEKKKETEKEIAGTLFAGSGVAKSDFGTSWASFWHPGGTFSQPGTPEEAKEAQWDPKWKNRLRGNRQTDDLGTSLESNLEPF